MSVAKYLCSIAIQKVQSYLFDAIQSHEQEKQTDAKTLCKVKRSSESISKDFADMVHKEFGENMLEVYIADRSYYELPSGSGSVLFVIEIDDTDASATNERFYEPLDAFYEKQYRDNKAAVRISYAKVPLIENKHYTEADGKITLNNSVHEQIKEVKKLQKAPKVNNRVIKELKETLFSFCKTTAGADRRSASSGLTEEEEEEQTIANQLENLRPNTDRKSIHSRKKEATTGFYIAYIKADLSGMGEAFMSVTTLDGYVKMSELLRECISIIALERKFKENEIKFYPIYAAGDDIFIAVRVSNIPEAVRCLTELLSDINSELRNHKIMRKSDSAGKSIQLSMRIGIDITFSNQPIRYYYQRTENQMETCRTAIPVKLSGSGYSQICMGNMVFLHLDKDAVMDFEYKKALKYVREYERERQKLREKYKEYKGPQKKAYDDALRSLSKRKAASTGQDNNTYQYYRDFEETFLDPIKPLWNDYISDIQLINNVCGGKLNKDSYAKNEQTNNSQDDKRAVTVSYLHNLLSILESEKKSNYYVKALYRLTPPKIQNNNVSSISEQYKCELIEEAMVWHAIAKHFVGTKKAMYKGRKRTTKTAKALTPSSSKVVIRYIKLLLLACDQRFLFDVGTIKPGTLENKVNEAVGDLHDYYTKILEQLYSVEGKKYRNLFNFFVESLYGFEDEKGNTYEDYVLLNAVEKSMLFRFKALLPKAGMVNKIPIAIANKIAAKELTNVKSTEEINDTTNMTVSQREREALNKGKRNTLNTRFSAENFKKASKLFTDDFIDLLIVFYSYHEIRDNYKRVFNTKKHQGGVFSAYIKHRNPDNV